MLEEHRKTGVIPPRDGRLPDGRVLLDRGPEVLFDLGHRAASLGPLHRGLAQRELIINDQGFSHSSAAGREAAKQCNENSDLHGSHLGRWPRLYHRRLYHRVKSVKGATPRGASIL